MSAVGSIVDAKAAPILPLLTTKDTGAQAETTVPSQQAITSTDASPTSVPSSAPQPTSSIQPVLTTASILGPSSTDDATDRIPETRGSAPTVVIRTSALMTTVDTIGDVPAIIGQISPSLLVKSVKPASGPRTEEPGNVMESAAPSLGNGLPTSSVMTPDVTGQVGASAVNSISGGPASGASSALVGVVAAVGALLLIAGGVFFQRLHKTGRSKSHSLATLQDMELAAPNSVTKVNMIKSESTFHRKQLQSSGQQAPLPPSPSFQVTPPTLDSRTQSIPVTPVVFSNQFAVLNAYNPTTPDGLPLSPGETVVIMHDYQNGWGWGSNVSTLAQGLFPLSCVNSGTSVVSIPQSHTNQFSLAKPPFEGVFEGVYGQVFESGHGCVRPEFHIGQTYTAVCNFIPDLPDELGLCIGDKLILRHIYDDSWCVATNSSTNKDGIFPLECVNESMTPERRADPDKSFPPRVSSECNTAPTIRAMRASTVPTIKEENERRTSIKSNESSIEIDLNVEAKVPRHMSLYTKNETLPRGDSLPPSRSASVYSTVDRKKSISLEVEGKVVTVKHAFSPQLEDEIELLIGDRVRVLEVYEDDWALGRLETGDLDEEGMFPMRCLRG
ncbi:hypothetical protein BC830DRAFT_1167324 [Chytriomyces sp. MP71]|nr:hypothetical protein BC830DRAFT_1167324 [Chytriomyces sp. MP71]